MRPVIIKIKQKAQKVLFVLCIGTQSA